MYKSDAEDGRVYTVLVNDEEQYSLWLKDKAVPPGWTSVGFEGSREACSAHVDTLWTDMRPLSLRRRMEASAN